MPGTGIHREIRARRATRARSARCAARAGARRSRGSTAYPGRLTRFAPSTAKRPASWQLLGGAEAPGVEEHLAEQRVDDRHGESKPAMGEIDVFDMGHARAEQG